MSRYLERGTGTKRLQLSLGEDLYDAVTSTARENDISASFLVNRIIRDWYIRGGKITIAPTAGGGTE